MKNHVPVMFPHERFSFNNRDLLNDISADLKVVLTNHRKVIHVAAGTAIFSAGDSPLGIYRVLQGKVKKSTVSVMHKEHIFYICGELEYLGYHALLSGEHYVDTATAMVDCEIEFIASDVIHIIMEQSQSFNLKLLRSLSHEFVVFVSASTALANYTVRERTALNLLILEHKFRKLGVPNTEVVITREDLASMVGTATESLVRMLKEFKEEGLITTVRRSIFIEDLQGLVQVSDLRHNAVIQ